MSRIKIGDRVYFGRGWGVVVAMSKTNGARRLYTVRLDTPGDYGDETFAGKEYVTHTVVRDSRKFAVERNKQLNR